MKHESRSKRLKKAKIVRLGNKLVNLATGQETLISKKRDPYISGQKGNP